LIRLPWFKTKRALSKALEPRKKNLSPTMTLEQKFNFIYENRLWGRDPERLSGPGSYGDCAATYLAFVRKFLSDYSIRSETDIGCGDFNIGSQLCDLVDRYYALDVSSTIVRRNRKRYAGFRNVTFAVADACTGELPSAELVTVRQVLPHDSLAIRAAMRSGVFINEPPFMKPAQIIYEIPLSEDMTSGYETEERLCVFFWDLTRQAQLGVG
jgi:hypothetical protein